MEKKEITKVLMKVEIIIDWFEDSTGGEYRVSIDRAMELLYALDEVK